MSTNKPTDRKSIAREHATDDPAYIGRDATGAIHYWSVYDRTVIVVEEDDVGSCDLSETKQPLQHWRKHTARDRGWSHHKIV